MNVRRILFALVGAAAVVTAVLATGLPAHAAPSPTVTCHPLMKLVNNGANRVWDIRDGVAADHSLIQMFDDRNGWNQTWRLCSRSDLVGFEIVNPASGKCVDIVDGSVADHAAVQLFTCLWGANQRFNFLTAAPGRYKISVEGSQKCIDIPNADYSAGTALQQYTCHGQLNQQFRIVAI